MYKCSDHRIGEFFLVDTPGFDDTYRTDTDILMEVSGWLSRAYQAKILLTGIIYLHRIFDNRLGGKAMKNLRSFRKLCGDDAFSKVVLATTFWNIDNPEVEERHETELKTKSDFWGSMISKGSRVFRQDNDKVSAREIIHYLVKKRTPQNPGATLAIQRQLVDQGKKLVDTDAGKEMASELAKQQALYEEKLRKLRQELEDAMLAKDLELQNEIKQMKDEKKREIAKAEADRKKLAADNADLVERLNQQQSSEDKEWRRMRDLHQQMVKSMQDELKMMDQRRASDEEKQRLRDQVREEKNKLDMLKWKIRQSQARCTVM